MNITVFGTGYVGLVTGACLADVGHNVICVDIDQAKIDKLKQGVIPIYEPGIEDVVKRCVAEGTLNFTTSAPEGVAHGTIQFIAVGTPPDEDGAADLQYVVAVAKTIGQHMDDYKVIVDKSTVPVGTAEKVKDAIGSQLQSRGRASRIRGRSNRSRPPYPTDGRRSVVRCNPGPAADCLWARAECDPHGSGVPPGSQARPPPTRRRLPGPGGEFPAAATRIPRPS